MKETVCSLSRQDRIREAYGRAVGDHDYSRRNVKDYHCINDLLPVIRATVPDVTLEEVCSVRGEDRRLSLCPVEIELGHAPWCLQVPTGWPTDPDLIGPFDTYEDAEAFTEAHPERCREANIRCLATPAYEILGEHHDNFMRERFAGKLGVTSDVLKPYQAPRDVTVEVNPKDAIDVARYLERNYPLPGVQEICSLLKIAATTQCVAYPDGTPRPPEPQLAR